MSDEPRKWTLRSDGGFDGPHIGLTLEQLIHGANLPDSEYEEEVEVVEIRAFLASDAVKRALVALFDEGVNFADFDEGKMGATEPDGYNNGDIEEVRRRALGRVLRALGSVGEGDVS